MKLRVMLICVFILAGTVAALSQQSQQAPPIRSEQHTTRPAASPHQTMQPLPTPAHDPIGGNLFPPELVMQHRRELGLTDAQRAAIKDEALKASTRFTELQWQMQDEMEEMAALMKSDNVDEQQALAQLDKVLNVEREVKRTQLGLAIRIKNRLTSEQQIKLQELRQNRHPPR